MMVQAGQFLPAVVEPAGLANIIDVTSSHMQDHL